nr:LytTR family DNA-binding domain-containing protein [Paeniclostridium ghonii]
MEGVIRLKIAICDDEKIYRDTVKSYIAKFSKPIGTSINVFEYDSGIKLLDDISDKNFDLIILDIVMDEMDGIDTAKKIRSLDKEVCIVFLTNYEEFAIRGYGLNVYKYLLKHSLSEEILKNIIYEVKKNKKTKTIILKMQKEIIKFDVSSIYFFEVNNRTITVHYDFNREYKTKSFYGKLEDIEKQLEGESFYRSHRSYIVNIKKIRKIASREIFFDIPQKAMVSRLKLLELKEKYINYNVRD